MTTDDQPDSPRYGLNRRYLPLAKKLGVRSLDDGNKGWVKPRFVFHPFDLGAPTLFGTVVLRAYRT